MTTTSAISPSSRRLQNPWKRRHSTSSSNNAVGNGNTKLYKKNSSGNNNNTNGDNARQSRGRSSSVNHENLAVLGLGERQMRRRIKRQRDKFDSIVRETMMQQKQKKGRQHQAEENQRQRYRAVENVHDLEPIVEEDRNRSRENRGERRRNDEEQDVPSSSPEPDTAVTAAQMVSRLENEMMEELDEEDYRETPAHDNDDGDFNGSETVGKSRRVDVMLQAVRDVLTTRIHFKRATAAAAAETSPAAAGAEYPGGTGVTMKPLQDAEGVAFEVIVTAEAMEHESNGDNRDNDIKESLKVKPTSSLATEEVEDEMHDEGRTHSNGGSSGSRTTSIHIDEDRTLLEEPSHRLFDPSRLPALMQWSRVSRVGCGLANLGNTCFMNAVLQCLAYTPPLVNWLLERRRKNVKALSSGKGNSRRFNALDCMTDLLPRIGGHITSSSSSGSRTGVISPTAIANNLRAIGRFRLGRQEDSHEFLIHLLDKMEQCVLREMLGSSDTKKLDKRVARTNPINTMFGGILRSQVRSLQTKYISNTYDPFVDVGLTIARGGGSEGGGSFSAHRRFSSSGGAKKHAHMMKMSLLHKHKDRRHSGSSSLASSSTLQRSLEMYIRPDILDGDNKYRDPITKRKVKASKQMTVFQTPPVLVVHLKRFNMLGRKINRHVDFDVELDMTRYTSQYQDQMVVDNDKNKNNRSSSITTSSVSRTMYDLYAVLVHSGSTCHSGHYYAFVKASNGVWYSVDDSHVGQVTVDTVLRQNPYLLFYTRRHNDADYQASTATTTIVKPQKPTRAVDALLTNTAMDNNKQLQDESNKKIRKRRKFGKGVNKDDDDDDDDDDESRKMDKAEDAGSTIAPSPSLLATSPISDKKKTKRKRKKDKDEEEKQEASASLPSGDRENSDEEMDVKRHILTPQILRRIHRERKNSISNSSFTLSPPNSQQERLRSRDRRSESFDPRSAISRFLGNQFGDEVDAWGDGDNNNSTVDVNAVSEARKKQQELLKRELMPKKRVRDEWDELLDEGKKKKVRGVSERDLVQQWQEQGNSFDRIYKDKQRREKEGSQWDEPGGKVSGWKNGDTAASPGHASRQSRRRRSRHKQDQKQKRRL